jgi:prepilin-type N-terminal cleavage/methylation domain-containing protein
MITTFDMPKKSGFTLIELLVVISIIGVLAVLVTANLNEARARARDAKVKQNLAQLKTALRIYFNDYNKYPAKCGINTIAGCGALGTTCCPVAGCPGFSAGGTGCSTVYMNSLPTGLGNNTIAYYSNGNDSFCIKANLENASDPDIASSWATCNSICSQLQLIGRNLQNKEYAVCPD